MYLPKLFPHASLILWMFVKMTFTSLFLPTLVIILNLLSFWTSKIKEKHCMGKVGTIDFFPLYRQLTLFYLTNLYSIGGMWFKQKHCMAVILLSFICNYDNFFFLQFVQYSSPLVLQKMRFQARLGMQARVDWVLIIFETQVIKKKWPVRPCF